AAPLLELDTPAPDYGVPLIKREKQGPAPSIEVLVPQPDIDQGPDPRQLADAAFQRFRALLDLPALEPESGAAKCQAAIEASLADPDLLNITARSLFERRVAELLAAGWKPGHEILFIGAGKAFGWVEDRRRLLNLGYAGALVNQAIDERLLFDSLPDTVRETQRKVIARLRRGDARLVQIKRDMATIERMAARFPSWLSLMVDADTVRLWRQQSRGGAGPARAAHAPQVAAAAAAPLADKAPSFDLETTKSRFSATHMALVFLVLAFSAYRSLSNRHPTPPYPQFGGTTVPSAQQAPDGAATHKRAPSWAGPAWRDDTVTRIQSAMAKQPAASKGHLSDAQTKRLLALIAFQPDGGTPHGKLEVRYAVELDAQGRVKSTNKIKPSRDPKYDKAVAGAILAMGAYPLETPRNFEFGSFVEILPPVYRDGTAAPPAPRVSSLDDWQFKRVLANLIYVGDAQAPQGTLKMTCVVNIDAAGMVKSIEKMKPSDDPRFDAALEKAIRDTQPYAASTPRRFEVGIISTPHGKGTAPADGKPTEPAPQ
ncbi:MAG: hypothetical protein ABIT83_26660, partial [Massilia sp.]